METSQRYIVREIEGYSNIGTIHPNTDVMVLDRWDCYHVVAYFPPNSGGGRHRLDQRRLAAAAAARKLEYDHRRWLREPSVQ